MYVVRYIIRRASWGIFALVIAAIAAYVGIGR